MVDAPIIGTNPLRAREAVRRLLTARTIAPERLIQVLIVREYVEGAPLLPTVSVRDLANRAKALYELGIGGIKLFVPELIRDETATRSVANDNLAVRAITEAKLGAPDLAVITETCLCSYTSSGSCVIVDSHNHLDRALTLDRMASQAILQARAGADILGPASMMDGMVSHIRQALNAEGLNHIGLMPHIEFGSSLYKSYRQAARTGDGSPRRGFQIETSNAEQSQIAAAEMVAGGADMLLVEPGLFFLDLIKPLKNKWSVPIGIFSVSGEHIMFKNFSGNADADEALRHEILTEYYLSAFRAGADYIVSYDAESVVRAQEWDAQ